MARIHRTGCRRKRVGVGFFTIASWLRCYYSPVPVHRHLDALMLMRRLSAVASLAAAVAVSDPTLAQNKTTGSPRIADKQSVVNFTKLAQQRALAPTNLATAGFSEKPRPIQRVRRLPTSRPAFPEQFSMAPSTGASPPPVASFLALFDNNTAIPPDTMGAVGPSHTMTTLNSQVRIQNRSGGVISTVDINSFWSSLGSYDVYDPRVAYDRIGGRWIFSAGADAELPTASVLVGVSATSDPTGDWYLFSVKVDPQNDRWADFDALGFNSNWIVVTANIFPTTSPDTNNPAYFVFDKADLFTNGAGAFTEIHEPSSLSFSVAPAQTFDPSVSTMYLIEDWDNTSAMLRISTITGPVGSEVLTSGTAFPTGSSAWEYSPPVANFLPQLGSSHSMDGGDSRILSCSYRNGSLWCSQTVFLPINAPSRAAAQWWQIDPSGTVQQFGRIDDPSGTEFFAYPSIAANTNNDVLVGYSRFSATQYASANYSFRYADDPPSTLRSDTVLKAGEGSYYSTGSGINRWGDFSATVVDPDNDLSFWTIQEYAGAPVGNPSLNGSGRWGTWWGRIDPVQPDVMIVQPAEGMTYPAGADVTITATAATTNVTLTKVEFFANGTRIGETDSAPFTMIWSNPANASYILTTVGTESSATQSTSSAVNILVGDPHSPLGTWDLAVSGANKGAAYLTFDDDFTFNGYGMVAGRFGLYTISGSWNFDAKHQVAGNYSEALNGIELFTRTITATATSGKSLKASISSGATVSPKLSGIPAGATTDLDGTWNIVGSSAKVPFSETYTLTPSATYNHVFDLIGTGAGYSLTGSVLIHSRNQLDLGTTNGAIRFVTGKFNSKKGTASLKGADDSGNPVKLQVTKP